jgi:gliding motility-associated-like protein
MRNFTYVIVFSFGLLVNNAFAQTSNCFQITSILVDACAPSGLEGQNEMVGFQVGPNDLDVTNMSVTWATTNISWLGTCQSAATALIVEQLNATIEACGFLIEPVNNILPANSKVILVTSSAMDVASNSFAGLTDTTYVIFHCGTSSTGHFANYMANGGIRTLSMSFSAPVNCAVSVSYDRALLVNQNGNQGAQDGATVLYDANGNATYINNGCNAPFIPLSANWEIPGSGVVCESDAPINLNDFIIGNIGGTWSGEGVSGNNFSPLGLSGSIEVVYTVTLGSCSVSDTNIFTVNPLPDATFSNPGAICSTINNFDFNPFITGDAGGTWTGNGISSAGIFNASGLSGNIDITYQVGVEGCSSTQTLSVEILDAPPPPSVLGPVNYCSGEEAAPLIAQGFNNAQFSWYSDQAQTNLVNDGQFFEPSTNEPNSLWVTQQIDGCESEATRVDIIVVPTPAIPNVPSEVFTCAGTQTSVSAQGTGTIGWYSNPQISNLILVGNTFLLNSGDYDTLYVVQTANGCRSGIATIVVSEGEIVTAEITPIGPINICQGDTIELSSNYADGNIWTGGFTTQNILVSATGTIVLSVEGACNVSEASVEINVENNDASFEANVIQGIAPLTVNFSILGEGTDCEWSLNGEVETLLNQETYTFTEPGTYEVKRTCGIGGECEDDFVLTITVTSGDFDLSVPNSFTPNGDNFNDFFKPKGDGVVELNAKIFNRWGQVIFEWQGFDNSWDGNVNGNPAPDGVYFYIIEAKDVAGKEFEKAGSITLLR